MCSFPETLSGEIIEIRPLMKSDKECFLINWNLGKRCNFSCSYCPRDLHDAASPHKSIDELAFVWENILKVLNKTGIKKKIKLEFTGGEPTLNPAFLNFCETLKKNYPHRIRLMGVVTNGSRPYAYFSELLKNLDWIVFSSHFEFMDENVFCRNVLLAARDFPGAHVMVNLMMEDWAREKAAAVLNVLQKENITVHARKVRNHYNSKGIENKNRNAFDYEKFIKEQPLPAETPLKSLPEDAVKTRKPQNIVVRTTKGSYPEDASDLILKSMNLFSGFVCHAGSQGIHIFNDGNVYSSVCRAKCLGNIYYDFNLNTTPVTCKLDRCNCTSDVKIPKERNA